MGMTERKENAKATEPSDTRALRYALRDAFEMTRLGWDEVWLVAVVVGVGD